MSKSEITPGTRKWIPLQVSRNLAGALAILDGKRAASVWTPPEGWKVVNVSGCGAGYALVELAYIGKTYGTAGKSDR